METGIKAKRRNGYRNYSYRVSCDCSITRLVLLRSHLGYCKKCNLRII